MISLAWLFYLMIIFFALVGSLRGWQREVLALAGLIASIAALNQFGFSFISPVATSMLGDQAVDTLLLERRIVIIQIVFHSVIAFFSYQVVARLANNVASGRLGDKVREGFQRRFIGAILGAVNGYLLIGGLWAFLEYQLLPGGYQRLPLDRQYVFDPSVIIRPALDSTAMQVAEYLPLGLLGPAWWLLFFFVAFFVVIIALI